MQPATTVPLWQHVLLPASNHAGIAETFRAVLVEEGYKPYDPFAGGTGAPVGIKTRLRAFVAPSQENWTGIFIAPQDNLPAALLGRIAQKSDFSLLAMALLNETLCDLTVYRGNVVDSSLSGLLPFLKAGHGLPDIEKVWKSEFAGASEGKDSDLPPELQTLAKEKGVNAGAVDKMMKKMSRRVFSRLDASSTEKEAAQSALIPSGINWQSPAALKLMKIVACLTVPEGWHLPEWNILTGAYQVARQIQRNAHAMLLPGDEETLAALPNVLDYMPLYLGKK